MIANDEDDDDDEDEDDLITKREGAHWQERKYLFAFLLQIEQAIESMQQVVKKLPETATYNMFVLRKRSFFIDNQKINFHSMSTFYLTGRQIKFLSNNEPAFSILKNSLNSLDTCSVHNKPSTKLVRCKSIAIYCSKAVQKAVKKYQPVNNFQTDGYQARIGYKRNKGVIHVLKNKVLFLLPEYDPKIKTRRVFHKKLIMKMREQITQAQIQVQLSN